MKTYDMKSATNYLAEQREKIKKPNIKGQFTLSDFITNAFKFWLGAILVSFLFAMTAGIYVDGLENIGVSPILYSLKFGWLALGLFVLFTPVIQLSKKMTRRSLVRKVRENTVKVKEFRLFLGTATGVLINKGHGSAPIQDTKMVLSEEDACKNILVEGGIGQGKTTLLMHSFLNQLFAQKCGGLIFDIKANFKNAVKAASEATGGTYKVLGPGHGNINLLEGLSPEAAAGFIKSVLLLIGKSNSDKIWLNTATDWCSAGLGILSFAPEYYNLKSLYLFLFDDNYADEITDKINKISARLTPEERRKLKAYNNYLEKIFEGAREGFIKDVRSTVAQVIGPFTAPELEDAFCLQGNTSINECLYTPILVDLPLEKWGVGAKTAYTFLKLRFFALMNHRQTIVKKDDNPVFMMCDEYQEIISANPDGLSDLSFWDKSRSAKCIGIVSWHGVSSLYAAIGDEQIADAIQQHFRQRMCLLTEDKRTIERINYLLGTVTSSQKSTSESTNKGIEQPSTTVSDSVTETDKAVVDAQLMRSLKRNQAVATLVIGGYAQDDVLEFDPIYL